METRPARSSALWLAAVVGIQILLLAFQVRRNHGPRLLNVWAAETYAPIASASTRTIAWLVHLWQDYLALHGAREENQRLRQEVADLRLQVQLLAGRAAEAERLNQLLAFRQAHPELSLLAAHVISASPASAARVIYIDRGRRDGVRRDLGVITPDGVVGKVLDAYPSSAQVLLISDPLSGVGALLAGSRTQGVVKGTAGSLLRMEYVSNDEKVQPGQQVRTSGLDGIFPKDLPVGVVVWSRPASPFQLIEVRPAAHLDRLEEVFVLLARSSGANLPGATP